MSELYPYVAKEIFEQSVNIGLSGAIRHAQQSLDLMGYPIDVDGVMGPQTVNTLNMCRDTETLLKCLNGFQFIWYARLASEDRSQKRFIIGWLKRVSLG